MLALTRFRSEGRTSPAVVIALAALLHVAPLAANTISLTGSLNPSDPNAVLLVTFTVAGSTTLTAQSYGYGGTSAAPGGTNAAGAVIGVGGFDTYASLFEGIGPTATFRASNDDGPCPPAAVAPACRDSQLSIAALDAGDYTLTLSVFSNFSFAENFGTGTLADGFIGLGSYYNPDSDSFRTPNYAIDLTADRLLVTSVTQLNAAVPEPNTLLIVGAVLAFVVSGRRKASNRRF